MLTAIALDDEIPAFEIIETFAERTEHNPHAGATTIPFHLSYKGDVTLSLWDLLGKQVK